VGNIYNCRCLSKKEKQEQPQGINALGAYFFPIKSVCPTPGNQRAEIGLYMYHFWTKLGF
jgi:hypothetical protein